MKKYLTRTEQSANFTHLKYILENAKTFKQLKSVWFELRKLSQEAFKEHGEECWILSKDQNDSILEAYNSRKFGEFAEEAQQQQFDREQAVRDVREKITNATSLEDLKAANKIIHTKVYDKEVKAELQEVSKKAYQEIMEMIEEKSA